MISGKEERHEGKGGWVEEEENKQRGRRRELGRGEEKMGVCQKIFYECQLSELFKSASSVTARTTQFKLLGKQGVETHYAIYIPDGVTP